MKKLLLLIINCVFLILNSNAQWSSNSAINNAICNATSYQIHPDIVSDGSGGAIIAWQDNRNGNYDIYAQRINASGVVQWTTDGAPVCTASDAQFFFQGFLNSSTIVNDGSGGAIITWYDYRNGSPDIYAQRINANGVVQWTTNGVPICSATNEQRDPIIIPDGSGGAVITWNDSRSGADIYAQRINGNGVVQWTADGVAVCTYLAVQLVYGIVTDGSGGAIITWQDNRSGNSDINIYARRINNAGVAQWTANGVAVCTATGNQKIPTIATDGSGGAILTWEDYRNGSSSDIYAQRINGNGVVQWTANGIAVCTLTNDQVNPTILTDGSSGGIITWEDARNSTSDIYAQRVNTSGVMQWTIDGMAVSTATGDQFDPKIITDGVGGVIIAWPDTRNSHQNIYAQRINSSGATQWITNGVAACTNISGQQSPTVVSDGSGGAILTWTDYRNSSPPEDIYAQNICSSGTIGPCLITSITEYGASGIHSWVMNNQLYVMLNSDNTNIVEEQKTNLNIFDISGKLLQSSKQVDSENNFFKMDISGLAQGIYIVSLQSENYIYSNKIIVSR